MILIVFAVFLVDITEMNNLRVLVMYKGGRP